LPTTLSLLVLLAWARWKTPPYRQRWLWRCGAQKHSWLRVALLLALQPRQRLRKLRPRPLNFSQR
jgi:hypothetical protein